MFRILALVTALTLAGPSVCTAQDFSYDTLLLGWMKLKGDDFDYKANADSYLRLYRADTWSQVKDDEFKLDAEKKKSLEIMKRKAKDFDLSEEITLTTRLVFEKYDFDNNVFPLATSRGSVVTKKTYWYPESRYPTGSLPDSMRLFFSNPELLASFPMDKDAAEKFVEGRKEYERVVTARVQFKLTKAREGAGELIAEVQSVTFHDTIGKKPLVHKATKPAAKDSEKKDEKKDEKKVK